MIGSVFFIFNRLVEIVFLIPIIGMLVCLYPSPIMNDRKVQTPPESSPQLTLQT